MNIGIVTVWFERGAAYVSRAYSESLARRHAVYIYARGGERRGQNDPVWDYEGVTWGRVTAHMPEDYIPWDDFKDWIKLCKLDVVIFNEQHNWSIVLKARKLPIVVASYIDYYTAETVPFYWLYDALFCNTERHFSVFSKHPQVTLIPWGTDVTRYYPHHHGPVEPGQVTFFHSSGLSAYRKGTDLLVSAFQGVKGPAKLVIHAQDELAKCFTWTKGNEGIETSQRIRNDPRINLIEGEVGAPGLYHKGDVYVYPSRLDGIGLSIAEALAVGLPVITTDTAPMNEMVRHGDCGRLVSVASTEPRWDEYYWPQSICSIQALTEAMQFYVDNRIYLPKFKSAARHHAENKLNWYINSQSLPDLVADLKKYSIAANRDLLKQVQQFEESKGRFPWLPLAVEDRLRRLRIDSVVRATRSLMAPKRDNVS